MITQKRNINTEIPDRIIRTEVISPKELLLTKVNTCREETEHRKENRHLEQHRQTSTHRTHTSLSVEIHHRLLLLHCILLIRILLVKLIDLRLEHLHLSRRLVRLDCKRRHHDLDENGHQKDDETVVCHELTKESEAWDDYKTADPTNDPPTERNDILIVLIILLQNIVVIRSKIEIVRDHYILTWLELRTKLGMTSHELALILIFLLREELDRKII